MNFPILSAIIFIPLIGALFIFVTKGSQKNVEKNSKYVAIFSSLANFLLSLFLWYSFDNTISKFQFIEEKNWIKESNFKIIYPSTIKIEIKEKNPIAIYLEGNNYYFLDEKGLKIQKLEKEDKIKHILISGDESLDNFLDFAELITTKVSQGGGVFFCGNGGSAADSQHLAAELVGRFKKNRKPIKSVALTTDTSAITSIGNDFGFEDIFSRQIEALCTKDDVLIAISTSGESKNILTFGASGLEGGGSTITQQLAKNLFKIRREKKGKLSGVPFLGLVISKVKEWIVAVKLEEFYTKKEILAMYLNTAE